MTQHGSRSTDASASIPDWDALARFVAGESPADEVARVEAWLAAHPRDRELLARLESATRLSEPADVNVGAALANVHRRMEGETTVRRIDTARRFRPSYALPVGLVLAAAAALVLFVWRKPATSSAPSVEAPVVASARTYETKTGQRDSLRLADGSRVVLGPESRLTVPADFGSAARAVELTGDAFFDVVHDAAKPFSVRVANAVIEDVGTAFTVESDSHDTTSVAVISGSVRLSAAGSARGAAETLSAGDRGSLSLAGTLHAYRRAVVPADSSWTHGVLVFRDASLRRVAGEVRRWFGVDLKVADSALLNVPITTTVRGNDPVDQVLTAIALSIGARVDRQGDSATLHVK